MKISVIIPVFNVSKYLGTCLDSVFSQTYEDCEVICVNDGSTDDSGSILSSFSAAHPGMVVIDQKNSGLSAARNTGLRHAHGEYLLFLDSDDWIEPHALERLSSVSDGQDMICFNGRRYLEDCGEYEEADTLTPEQNISGWDYYNKYSLQPRRFAFVCVVLRAYRREFLIKNDLWFAEGIYHEDNRFTPMACYYAKDVRVINDVLYTYRIRRSSITTTRNLKRDKDLLETANMLSAFFVEKEDCSKTVIYRALTHHYQAPFARSSAKEDKDLLPLINWRLYKTVSRTKARHKIQYLAMRINPAVFRLANRI